MKARMRPVLGGKVDHPTKVKKVCVFCQSTDKSLTMATSTVPALGKTKFTYRKAVVSEVLAKPLNGRLLTKHLLRGYGLKEPVATESDLLTGGKPAGRVTKKASGPLLDGSRPIAERLRVLGAEPGNKLEDAEVAQVIRSITAGAEDVTGSAAAAHVLLANSDFDGTGLTVEQLVRDGRAGRVLSRLDDLRYGARN